MKEHDVPAQLADLECPGFSATPLIGGPPLSDRRIAVVSTAGLMHSNDPPFSLGAVDYRIIDAESDEPILMSHISTNFDRSGFVQDTNLVMPLDRLGTMAEQGEIGSMARYHYSFMGATEPEKMKPAAEQLAATLRGDEVTGLLLVPV